MSESWVYIVKLVLAIPILLILVGLIEAWADSKYL